MDSNNFNSLHEAYLSIYNEATLDRFDVPDAIGAEKNAVYAHDKPGHHAPGYKYSGRRDPQGNPEQVRFKKDISAAVARSQERQLQKQSYEYEAELVEGIIDYLISEGYAETAEAAEVIMMNMSEGWIQTIVEMDDFSAGGGNAKMKQTGMSRAEVEALGKKNLTRLASKPTTPSSLSSKSSGSAPKSEEPKKEPIRYGQKISKPGEPAKYAPAGKVTARHKFHTYQRSRNAADDIASWYKLDRKDPKVQADLKKWADTNYRQNIAMDSDDPNYDPTKTSYPKFTPNRETAKQKWDRM